MNIGIGCERGKRIPDREAFGYACNRCLYGSKKEIDIFEKAMKDSGNIEEFAKNMVESFFKDNWIYDGTDNNETVWIIRFSNNELLSYYGTYVGAVFKAREEADKRGMGFVVN